MSEESTPRFYNDLNRLPQYDGWYWWRLSPQEPAKRYFLQYNGKWATPEGGGESMPTKIMRGEWGYAAPSPDDTEKELSIGDHMEMEYQKEKSIQEAYTPVGVGYTGNDCTNCGRCRVIEYKNGKLICEKCHWDQGAQKYDSTLRV